MTSACEDFGHIARRLAEIRAERERHFGVILHPLPKVDPAPVAEVDPDLGDYGFY